MISFIGKVVEAPIHTPGKRIGVKVVWKSDKFIARFKEEVYEIDGWNDLSKCKWVYSLPKNSYFSPWHKKPYIPPIDPDKDVLAMTLRYYGKYRHGMTIYGKVVDGIFYESKHNEPALSETITE